MGLRRRGGPLGRSGIDAVLGRQPRRRGWRLDPVLVGHLLEGLRFTWHRKTVLGAISLDLFAVLFGGASALLPAFTRDVLHAGRRYSVICAAPGVGAVAMAILLAARPITRRVGVYMFGASPYSGWRPWFSA